MPVLDIYEPEATEAPGGDASLRELFEADLAWMVGRGVECRWHTFTLGQADLIENSVVRSILHAQGAAVLPLLIAGESIISAGGYPTRDELIRGLGLECREDERYLARRVAAAAALGYGLAHHNATAIDAAYKNLARLGVSRTSFEQAVGDLIAGNILRDSEAVEALERLTSHGTARLPMAGCCATPAAAARSSRPTPLSPNL